MKSLIIINNRPLSKKDFMTAVDSEIFHLYETGDINRVMNVLNGMDEVDNVVGKGKACLLWAGSEWFKINEPDKDFIKHVGSTTTTKEVTAARYILTWQYVENYTIPKEISDVQPMRNLVPIAQTVKWAKLHDKEISKAEWRKIDLASNDGELRDVLRKIKGKAEKKSARVLKIASDGSLYGWKDNQRYFLGYLVVTDASDSVTKEFVEKIKISASIIEE